MNSGRYWLTRSAENDLADIAKYTLETWGEKQLEIYRHRLEKRLVKYANQEAHKRTGKLTCYQPQNPSIMHLA